MFRAIHLTLLKILTVCFFAQVGSTIILAKEQPANGPVVAVSIRPVHSLVAGVMQGVGEPSLIIKGAGSPHSYKMKPGDAKTLSQAIAVFWIGEEFETFLKSPIRVLAKKARIVELSAVQGLTLHKFREGGLFATNASGGHEEHAHHGHDHGAHDLHLWLDPRNAKLMVRHIAGSLAQADPSHESLYRANAAALFTKLDALDGELAEMLGPAKGSKFMVQHDAYQYLEARYGLTNFGSISDGADRAPGAKRLREIRDRVREQGVKCFFAEPGTNTKLLSTVSEGTGAQIALLDPLGTNVPEGPDLYFTLMRNMASSIRDCLAR